MKKKLVLYLLLAVSLVASQSCKSLFKSDYAVLKADEVTALLEAYPETYRLQIAQSEMIRKKIIDDFKNLFARAQAAEAAGLDKSDEFKRRSEFIVEQILAVRYTERNPDLIVSKEEWEAYYAAHKDQFDDYFKLITANVKQPITDAQKEQQREIWSQTKTRAEKARQAGLDKESGFAVLVKFGNADLLEKLYTRSVEEKNKLTDDEKKKYMAEHPSADPDKQKEKAQGLLDRIKKGENFEKVASEFSDDPRSKTSGGDLGWFGKGRMDPAFEAAAFALQKGQTTGELVKTRFGYHIIRVEDRRMTAPKPDPKPDPKSDMDHAPQAHGQAPERQQEPKEEIRARHILIDTTEFEQYETQQVRDKVKRELEDVALKYAVEAPTDFFIKGAESERKPIPGGGQDGSIK
ncbi:MAG TPA: peptidylprolyl isomerase [Blastocatellia bacterium]|nr:peptidylprolyl isomerase [Blastocatellia bacterium]